MEHSATAHPLHPIHPLRRWMDAYGWLILRLVPLFGTDRVVLASGDLGGKIGIAVSNGKAGDALKRHAMWIERHGDYVEYSLNALPEEQRDTVVRKFVQDAKLALEWK